MPLTYGQDRLWPGWLRKLKLSHPQIAFHRSSYRTFKDCYQQTVLANRRDTFPNLVSYGGFAELLPRSLMALVNFLNIGCFGRGKRPWCIPVMSPLP